MTLRAPLQVALSAALLASATQAGNPQSCNPPAKRCDPGCYTLSNKINGYVSAPDYGLRLDGLFGAPGDHWTFDFEDPQVGVEMCYDGAGTVTIHGLAFGGHDVGSQWDPNSTGFLEIHFTYENAICVGKNGNELVVDENQGGVGYGTVTWLNTNEVIHLSGKADNQGRLFIFDHENDDPARGWVMYGDGHVGDFAMTIAANDDCPPGPDCDGDGTPDDAEADCDANGVPDDCEPSEDCDGNGVPDRCDINESGVDLDDNGVLDRCEPGTRIYCFGVDNSGGGGLPCPCGNEVVPGANEGCANATGVGASLTTSGSTSIAAADLVLNVIQVPNAVPGYFFAGNAPVNGGNGIDFGNGLRCIGGGITRLGKIPTAVGGTASFPPQGGMPVATIVGASPGDVSYLQFWYRDGMGACGGSANMSNAVSVTWAP